MRSLFTISLMMWTFISCFAQYGRLFSADREISNSLIYQIYQDRNKIIWIATEDGLNRYDGSKFTIYKHNKNDSLSLRDNFVRVLFEDSKGRLFVGLFHGLQFYDPATDAFSEITMITDNDEIIAPHITSIIERKNGDILIGTAGEGIYILTSGHGKLQAKQVHRIVPSILVLTMYEDKKENLWVSTEDKGLYRLSHDSRLKIFYKYNISGVCEDEDGNILIGSMNQGIFRHDRNTDSFIPVPYPGNPDLPVKTLYANDSVIYIGTDGYGVKEYKSGENKVTDCYFDVTTFDFEKSKVHAILKDNADNLWLGIFQKGVILVPAQTNKFNYIGYKSVKNNIIGSGYVTSICPDSQNGTLWVATDNDGIYHISLDGKQYAHFIHSENARSMPTNIMCVLDDSRNNLWVGSYLKGLAKLDKKTGACTYITHFSDENEVPVQSIYCLVEGPDKQIWIGTMGAGLFSMDPESLEITSYNKPRAPDYDGPDNFLYNYWVSSLLFSSDNKLYVGTFNGLVCLDLTTRNYVSTFGEQVILPGCVIYALHEDEQGTVWIGTVDGLISIDGTTREIKTYTTEDGLPNNTICAIKGDYAGNLWISTHYGISEYNLANHTFINYYADDGLQGNEFSKRAVNVDLEGHIFFGGINGITWFNPQEIVYQKKKLNMRITDFYIHDQPVRKGTRSGRHAIIETSVMDADEFRLSYKDNSFSIEFSVMEFVNPERITYTYSVNDEGWISLHPGTNRVSFTYLSPGRYDFKVRAKDYNSYSDEKNISVVISSPWYLTDWAKFLYFLVFATIGYLLILQVRQRYRSRQRIIEHQHAKEINEAKLQFFINIAHEIRTPMSLIINPLKKLITNDSDKERQKSYRTIRRNTERILNLINELMDVRKIDKGIMVLKFQEVEIVAFIRDLYSYFEYQEKAKNIDFRMHTGFEQLPVWIDPGNFDKIIMNVLSNAFKYTPENGQIDIYLNEVEVSGKNHKVKRYFETIVSDNGIGIREEERERIFERFYQIRNSYNNSNVSTGVGLHLTRSLVELHHGTIRVESNEGGGSRFIIRIPLGKEHLKPEEMEDNPGFLKKQTPHFEIEPEKADMEQEKVKSKTKHRIMIVEDDDEIRKYVSEELAENYHITECVNGKDALAAILKKAPDLVISDVMMPEMDGITLCRKIKQNININHIPVILVTAKTKEEDNLEGLDTGADAYIVKPFNIDILKKTVGNMIRNRELLRNTFQGSQQQENKMEKIQIKSSDEKLMERVMKMINENISNPDLSVELIADRVGISRVHLHRKLKELTNQTTRDFIRNIRLIQAASLLADKHLSISEVAEATGFSNLGYFSNTFREFYGVTPTAYMEEHKKNQEEG